MMRATRTTCMAVRVAASLLLMALAFLIATTPAHAIVDLIGPAHNTTTSMTTIGFDYYVSMENLAGCTLNLGGQQFPDADAASNGMNSVQVSSLASGTYAWNMSCTNGTTELSMTRTLTVDNQTPTLTIISPLNSTTVKLIALDMIPYDGTDPFLDCEVRWGNETLETATVAVNTHYLKNYTGAPGNRTLAVACTDDAGNEASTSRSLTLLPEFSLRLQLDQQQFGLGEPPRLTIDTIAGANVTVDICPDQIGFVQCTSALIDGNAFPQTITLPTMNRTGGYIVDGMATYGSQTKLNRTGYNVTNTMVLATGLSDEPRLNRSFTISASVTGGIAPYRLSWLLSNGTVINGASTVNMTHRTAGNYTHRLTAYDQANNTKSVNVSYTIDPVHNVVFKVLDGSSNDPIVGAELDISNSRSDDELTIKTIQGGIAQADLEHGTHRIFITAPNYEYFLEEYIVNVSGTVTIRLTRALASAPQVTITAPVDQGAVRSPAVISYSAVSNHSLTCTLLFGDENNWFKPNGTQSGLKGDFTRDLGAGTYRTRIECVDARGRTGSSGTVQFSVSDAPLPQQVAALAEEQQLQDRLAELDALLETVAAYGTKEKEAATLLGYDRQLRNTKRAVQQAIRDVSDLQFRQDLDDASRQAERKRIIQGANDLIKQTPTGLRVIDSKTYVRYLEEDDVDKVAATLAGIDGMPAQKRIASTLLDEQQKFTVSSRLLIVEQSYGDGRTEISTIVTRSFTYADGLASDYRIYEIIPQEAGVSELTMITKGEAIKDGALLRFATLENITYIIPKRVDIARLEGIRTVLARPQPSGGSITGFAIFSAGDLSSSSWPIIALVAAIVLAYLVYYFDIVKQVKYLSYRLGKKEKVHYLRVIVNDAIAELDANNYEKAELLYKEARLSYEALSVPGRNETYDDLMDLVHRMDAYYFNMVMIELDGHLKALDMARAIDAYEKLTHIYERLDEERQQQLVQAVVSMGKRLGVAA